MVTPDLDIVAEELKESNDPLYKLTDAYVHELEIRAESGDQGAIIELQQREIAEENTKTAITLYAIAAGGYYAATVTPELAAAAKAGAITCTENPILCANQVGTWIIEMLGADAAPAGIAITGSTATAKLTVNQLSELSALKSMQQQGGKVSPEMVSKSLSSKSLSSPNSAPQKGASAEQIKINNKSTENSQVHIGSDDVYNYFKQDRKYWSAEPINFNGNKVYQRNDLFDPQKISSWKEKGQTVTGTNLERMASGRAPIGTDGKSINLHHMTQKQDGPIAETTQSFHQGNSSVIHINPNTTPSGIDRSAFDKWKNEYWKQRAKTYGK